MLPWLPVSFLSLSLGLTGLRISSALLFPLPCHAGSHTLTSLSSDSLFQIRLVMGWTCWGLPPPPHPFEHRHVGSEVHRKAAAHRSIQPSDSVGKNHKSMSHLDSAETAPANVPVPFLFFVGQTCSRATVPSSSLPSNWLRLLGEQTSACQAMPGFGSTISDTDPKGRPLCNLVSLTRERGRVRKGCLVPQQITGAGSSLQSKPHVAQCVPASTLQQRSMPQLKDSPCSPPLPPF